jgi:hypothetical protein
MNSTTKTTSQEQPNLYAAIASHPLDDPGSPCPFAVRLARENRWSLAQAERVVAEYRKFLFLAAASGHLCSPSKMVDQAWHLHLLDTRNYWDRFCAQVLGRALHHQPDRGGPGESARLDRAYRETLDSYRNLLGSEPPVDIWPPSPSPAPATGASGPGATPRETRARSRVPGLAALASAALLGGCEAYGRLSGVFIVGLVAAVVAFAFRSGRAHARGTRGSSTDRSGSGAITAYDGSTGGSGCDPATGDCGDAGGAGGGDGGGGAGCGGGGGCGGGT